MNKTRKIEITVELIRIVAAVAIAYAIALLTLVVFSDEPVYIIQQLLFKMDIIQQIKAQIFQQLDFLFLCIIAVLNDI